MTALWRRTLWYSASSLTVWTSESSRALPPLHRTARHRPTLAAFRAKQPPCSPGATGSCLMWHNAAEPPILCPAVPSFLQGNDGDTALIPGRNAGEGVTAKWAFTFAWWGRCGSCSPPASGLGEAPPPARLPWCTAAGRAPPRCGPRRTRRTGPRGSRRSCPEPEPPRTAWGRRGTKPSEHQTLTQRFYGKHKTRPTCFWLRRPRWSRGSRPRGLPDRRWHPEPKETGPPWSSGCCCGKKTKIRRADRNVSAELGVSLPTWGAPSSCGPGWDEDFLSGPAPAALEEAPPAGWPRSARCSSGRHSDDRRVQS